MVNPRGTGCTGDFVTDMKSCGSIQIVLAECKLGRKESLSKGNRNGENMNGDRKGSANSRCGCQWHGSKLIIQKLMDDEFLLLLQVMTLSAVSLGKGTATANLKSYMFSIPCYFMPITGFAISEGQDTGETQQPAWQLEETCLPCVCILGTLEL